MSGAQRDLPALVLLVMSAVRSSLEYIIICIMQCFIVIAYFLCMMIIYFLIIIYYYLFFLTLPNPVAFPIANTGILTS